MTRGGFASVAIAAWIAWGGSAQDHGPARLLRDAAVVDLALHLDTASIESLSAARERDVPGTLTVGGADRGGPVLDVMVHVKGQLGSARTLDDKPAFKIKIANGERLVGVEHLTLNNMVQDPTMLHEALGYQVYADAGVPVPDTGYVRLTVNGQPYGLYLDVETIDRRFLKRRFGDDSGVLYEGAYGADLRAGGEKKLQLDEGQDPDGVMLAALVRAVDAPGDGVFYGAAAPIDTRSFLSMMAVQALIADWDNYYQSNNYRIYWNPTARRWFFIPTGIDQTFTDDSTAVFGATGLLFQKCLASERCTADYAGVVRDIAGRFERLGLAAKMTVLLSAIDAPSQEDPKKPYDAATMAAAREAMRTFIATRPNAVRSSLSCIKGGREVSFAACAGAVLISPDSGRCAEIASRSPDQRGVDVKSAECRGGVKQRWRLRTAGGAVSLEAVGSGHCLDVVTDSDEDATLRQAACGDSNSQRFVRRSRSSSAQTLESAVRPGQRWIAQRSTVR
jgi:hypothetical protein